MRNRKNKMNKIEYSSRIQMKKKKQELEQPWRIGLGASGAAVLGASAWASPAPGLGGASGWWSIGVMGGGVVRIWAHRGWREISFSGGGACFCSCGRLRDLLLRWSHDGLAESRWPRDLLLRRWSGHSRAYGERR
jgi:hypothetical protein